MGLFEGFIHPALAWGALLASVPLLIHLLNRQRHKPMPWAAMRFVLAAYRKTRRRAQLENLLLLLLRMAAVALLALAISRPFTGKNSPLTAFTESRRDMVLIVDASASTGYRESVQSVYEVVLERARAILTDLDGTRGDRVRLILASSGPTVLSERSPEDALALLSTLSTPSEEALDLAAVLAEVAAHAEKETGGEGESSLEIRLLSDLQRNSFVPRARLEGDGGGRDTEEAPVAPLIAALDRLSELGLRVTVEDLGPGALLPANLGIEAVEPLGELLGPGIPSEIGVRVRNYGSAGRSAVRVALEVDGVRQPSQKLDLSARSSAELVFPVSFQSSGHHTLSAQLEGDRLALDDQRATVVHVPSPVRILMVDGDPQPEVDRDEVGYLRAVLEPPVDDGLGSSNQSSYSPFDVTVVPATSFGANEEDLGQVDVLMLANLASLSGPMVERIEERVAAGAALLITLGDRVADPTALEAMNARLWRSDGTGLLPGRLFRSVSVRSRRDGYYRAATFDETHPILSFFADERWRPFFTEVPIYEFVAVEPAAETRVLASLDDDDKSPLLLERPYDRGRVLLWTTSIDDDWTRLPESPATLVPFAHELFRYAGQGNVDPRNVSVGAALALEVAEFPRSPSVVRPNGTRRELDGEALEVAAGIWRLPAVADTDESGLWKIEAQGAPALPFAVQVNPEEGDLERIAPAELESAHAVWRVHQLSDDEDTDDDNDSADRGELWRWLAAMALLALVFETLWSAWISRGRRMVS